MGYLQSSFKDIEKNVRQELASKMMKKMVAAAEKTMSHASDYKDYDDVTGNLYKSTAIGIFRGGNLEDIVFAPGEKPTRKTLAKGEKYDLDKYYGSPFYIEDDNREPYVGQYGKGGETAQTAAVMALRDNDGHTVHWYNKTWQMLLVTGVNYAEFVEKKRGHDVITKLGLYMGRYFKKM